MVRVVVLQQVHTWFSRTSTCVAGHGAGQGGWLSFCQRKTGVFFLSLPSSTDCKMFLMPMCACRNSTSVRQDYGDRMSHAAATTAQRCVAATPCRCFGSALAMSGVR